MSTALAEVIHAPATSWPAYPAYKDSGIEWLGKIPNGWITKPLKQLVELVSRGNTPEYVDQGAISVLNQACIQWDGLHLENRKHQRETDISSWKGRLQSGDVVLNSTGTGTLGRAALFDAEGVWLADGHVTIIRVNKSRLHPPFLKYLLTAPLYQGYIYAALVAGSTNQVELSRERLRATHIILPSLMEQQAIAAWLDHEAAQLDALVAKKERLIALVEEKRIAFISHAVTKGFSPDAPMKDSGIGWLGEIPAHWEIKRTKVVARLESGHTPSRQHPEYWVNCTIPWFSLADVWQLRDGQREYVTETKEAVSELGIANSAARLLPAGTVIVSRTASVGFSGIMARPMATTQDFVNWVCGPLIQPEFLLYVFRAMRPEFRRLIMGSTHQTIYMPDVERFVTPVPPRPEQEQIVAHIRAGTAKLDGIITKTREQLVKLQEYRTALITAAVTGQIDVRGEVMP